MKLKKYIKRHLRRIIIKSLPPFLRYKLLRSMIHLNYNPDPRLTFKIASNKNELSSAFKILHDEYVRQGYMEPHPSGMRITIYHALPETTTLVALFDGEVVGTVSIIRRTGLKLPLEKIFDISEILQKEDRCVEVSALAIKKEFQKMGGEILFPLLKFLTEYCREYMDVRVVLIAIHPNSFDYYAALFFFKYITKKTAKYSYVNDVPAVGGFFNIDEGYLKVKICYHKKADKRNLQKYFRETKISNIKYPERKYFTTSFPVMTPGLLRYFFLEKSNVFKTLTKKEHEVLKNIYSSSHYAKILPKFDYQKLKNDFRSERFPVSCPGIIVLDNRDNIKIQVANVSEDGIGAFLDESLYCTGIINAKVKISEFEVVELELELAWCDIDKNYYGFKIKSMDKEWKEFVSYSEKKLLQMKTAVFMKYKKSA